MKSVTLLLASFLFSSLLSASPQETAVDRIMVPVYSFVGKKSLTPQQQEFLEKLQSQLVDQVNNQTYLDAQASDEIVAVRESQNKISKLARENGVDGFLAGEINGSLLMAAIKSGLTGRTLATYRVPLKFPLDQNEAKLAAKELVEALVKSFPYRGFVIASKRATIKLNLGKKQLLKKGQRLSLFEFQGDAPSFSSSQKKLGEAVVSAVGQELLLAVVVDYEKPIPTYTKVAFADQIKSTRVDSVTRFGKNFWMSAGGEFVFFDTQASEDSASLRKRMYRLNLTPFLTAAVGYNRIAVEGSYGFANNSSNEVRFLRGQISYEVLRFNLSNWGLITSVGAAYTQYEVSAKDGGAATPLISTTSYSPLVEQRIQWVNSPRTKLYVGGSVFPFLNSSDLENGNSTMSSFGAGVFGGLRIDFSQAFGLEAGANTRLSQVNLSSGTTLQELQFGLFTKGLFFF